MNNTKRTQLEKQACSKNFFVNRLFSTMIISKARANGTLNIEENSGFLKSDAFRKRKVNDNYLSKYTNRGKNSGIFLKITLKTQYNTFMRGVRSRILMNEVKKKVEIVNIFRIQVKRSTFVKFQLKIDENNLNVNKN